MGLRGRSIDGVLDSMPLQKKKLKTKMSSGFEKKLPPIEKLPDGMSKNAHQTGDEQKGIVMIVIKDERRR